MFRWYILLLLILFLSGCGASPPAGGGEASATAGPSATAGSPGQSTGGALEFVRCLRERGLTIDDPPADGSLLLTDEVIGDADYPAAYGACKSKLPAGTEPKPGAADPERLDLLRRFAACLRENGLPDFPDPDPNKDTSAWKPPSQEAHTRAARICVEKLGMTMPPTGSGG